MMGWRTPIRESIRFRLQKTGYMKSDANISQLQQPPFIRRRTSEGEAD